ncbi:MAG: NAD(P)H-dependent oxidoreductase [marine benthic group bacterium]|jgi:NAD(P)H dehydrogenase (quinone)|nr:NAD(P)H-dependent oxidoreductase [Candidatus Benthicola marisminoris]
MRKTLTVGLGVLASCVAWAGPISASPAESSDTVRVLVIYHSDTGHTRALAEAVAEGARAVPGAQVVLKTVQEAGNADLEACDALLIGTPTFWGSVATPVKQFIDGQRPFMGDKVGGAFATGGSDGGGKELAVLAVLTAMLNNGMIVAGPHYEEDGFRFGGFGATATTGKDSPGMDEAELARGRALGERVARVAQRYR